MLMLGGYVRALASFRRQSSEKVRRLGTTALETDTPESTVEKLRVRLGAPLIVGLPAAI